VTDVSRAITSGNSNLKRFSADTTFLGQKKASEAKAGFCPKKK
jgi:hypothetical protein